MNQIKDEIVNEKKVQDFWGDLHSSLYEEVDPQPFIYYYDFPNSILEGNSLPVMVDAMSDEVSVTIGFENQTDWNWGISNFEFVNLVTLLTKFPRTSDKSLFTPF